MNKIDRHNNKCKFTTDYYVFNENRTYISYCPSLDLSTSGDTINEAKNNFKEMFKLILKLVLKWEHLKLTLKHTAGKRLRIISNDLHSIKQSVARL